MDTLTQLVNILSVVYVSIPIIVSVAILVLHLIGKTPKKESLEKLLDFGKWYMVAVALVFAAKTLDNSFTDRETSIKEMAIYEKYANNILEADNLVKRWKLSQYFAAVTPSQTLRERWQEYKNLVKQEYDSMVKAENASNKIAVLKDSSERGKSALLSSQRTVSSLDIKLGNSPKNETNWIVVFTADVSLAQSKFENSNLKKVGLPDVIVVNKGRFFYNISGDYSSRNDAIQALSNLGKKVRQDSYVTESKRFCDNKTPKESYYICQ